MDQTLTVGDQSTTLYVARPAAGAAGTPVLLLHAWWGLNTDVHALAERLATAGFTVAAPDLFRGEVAGTVDEAERLSSSADDAFIEKAVTAALDTVLQETGSAGPVAVIGFSFGAAWAIWLSAQRADVDRVVLYYGTWVGPILAESKSPILGHFAENDPYEDADTVAALQKICSEAGRTAEVYTYPGTGHWFAEPSQAAYVAHAADLAFGRTVEFLSRPAR
jgi:carboxymethylenebutenolidase